MTDKKIKSLPVVTSRCSGLCCARFPLSVDTTVSAVEVLEKLRNHPGGPDMHWQDEEKVLAMILPLQGPIAPGEQAQGYFTCRHFDGKDCTDYDNRPDLCRSYGVSDKCDHAGKGCTLELTLDDVPVHCA